MRSSSPIWLDGEPFQNLSRICNLIGELHRVIHQPNRKRPVTPPTDASHLVQVSGQAYTEAPSTFGEDIMGDSKAKRRISFSAMAIGLLLTSSPILARLFPIDRRAPEQVSTTESDYLLIETSELSITTFYISPWVPALGGILIFGGGLALASVRKSRANSP